MIRLPSLYEMSLSKANLIVCSDKSEVKGVMELMRYSVYRNTIDSLHNLTNPAFMDAFIQTVRLYDDLRVTGVIDRESLRNCPELEKIKGIVTIWGGQEE